MIVVFRNTAISGAAIAGGMGLILVLGLAAIAPVLYPNSPFDVVGKPFEPPFGHFFLGTDSLGRNMLAELLYGARTSLMVGVSATIASALIGVLLGSLAGYYGGMLDNLLMRVTEFFQTVPSFLFAILLVAVLGPSIKNITIAIALVSWPPLARIIRAEFLSLREREYVLAAECLGASDLQIIFLHLLPNCLGSVLVMSSLIVANAILVESALSFLGLGDSSIMSWGYMIGSGRSFLRMAWWLTAIPGAAIVMTVLSINLIGEGLSDALNPGLQRRLRT